MNSTAHRPANPVAVFLAGLQAGMIGICWMLAWLGLSAMGQSRSFWTAENLMASVFHGGAAIRRGFGFSTLSGIALYLLVYSLLGAGFAVAVRNRFTGLGTGLLDRREAEGQSISRRRRHSPRLRLQHVERYRTLPAGLQPAGRRVRRGRAQSVHRPGDGSAGRALFGGLVLPVVSRARPNPDAAGVAAARREQHRLRPRDLRSMAGPLPGLSSQTGAAGRRWGRR